MAKQSLTHRYIPRIQREEENLFMEEYYSSTDTKIYFNDSEHTEIGYISYSMQEQLKPIFGYASRTWDDVAVGARTVTGVFKIPIKNMESQSSIKQIRKRGYGKVKPDVSKGKKLVKEWTTGTDSEPVATNSNNKAQYNDNKAYKYKAKLVQIYPNKLDTNSDDATFRKVIMKFQKDNDLDQTGELNTQTKKAINEAFKQKNNKKVTLAKNSKIYTGPSTTYSSDKVNNEKEATVIDTLDNGWKYVLLPSGRKAYVKA